MVPATTPLKELTLTNFSSLLDKLQLAPLDDWDKCWSLLSCSKLFLRGFANCKVDDIVVIYDKNNNFSDLTRSDKDDIFLFKNKGTVRYPCTVCSSEVDNTEKPKSGQELQCSRCHLYFHNQCTNSPISKEFRTMLGKSPEYVQIICPPCMEDNSNIEALHKDIGVIKEIAATSKGTYQSVVSSNSKQPEGKQIIQEIRDLRRRHPSKEEKEEKDARTLIVRKPMTTEIKNTPAIKREFNKHHQHLVIRGARTTPAGSIVIELDDPEEAKRVKENWKADSFGGNSGVVHPSEKGATGIILEVDNQLDEAAIREEIGKEYSNTILEFYTNKRTGKFTGTVKMQFKDRSVLERAMKENITIGRGKYPVQEFRPQPRVIKCHRCQGMSHIAKNCSSRFVRCGKCSSYDHQTRECVVTADKYKCVHCNGKHITGSRICTAMKEKEEQIISRSSYGY